MSKFNLKDELFNLSNTAPKLKDPEDDFSDEDITRARVDPKSSELDDLANEFEDGSSRRRIRPALNDLSEYGKRYKGAKISRKELNDDESDGADDDEDDLEDEESQDEDDDELDEEDDVIGEEDDEKESESLDNRNKKRKLSKSEDEEEKELNLINMDRNEDVAKGKAVKNQLNTWDLLLEARIKMQNVLNTVNLLPQHDYFDKLLGNLTSSFKKVNDQFTKENQSYVVKAFNQLIELQQRFLLNDPDTSYLIKELNLNNQDESNSKTNAAKRKRPNNSDGEEEEEEEDENESDESDEEIYSDTDEEMRAQEMKKALKDKKLKKFQFTPLKPDQFEDYLAKINEGFKKYRNLTIQKWNDKTRLITGKSFQTLEKPLVQQIEHILMDKDRIIKRTQLKRGQYQIVGKKDQTLDSNTQKQLELIGNEKSNLRDYDSEIFDDQDFYNQLLRELIDRKSTNISDPIELSKKSIELQQLRSKNKKQVDTKASKGRKIKYDIHKPMVNFMAPIYRNKMSEEARNELFNSLFGNHITVSSSNGNNNQQKASSNDNIDFNQLFKGF